MSKGSRNKSSEQRALELGQRSLSMVAPWKDALVCCSIILHPYAICWDLHVWTFWLVLSLVSFVAYILANLSFRHSMTMADSCSESKCSTKNPKVFSCVWRDWVNQCSLQEGTLVHRIAGCYRCQPLLLCQESGPICFDSETVTAGINGLV